VVVRVKNLADVMQVDYEQRTVLLVDKVNGEEEVPTNVQAIIYLNPLTGDHPDVLAHVSVRARNLKVMLAVVFDEAKCKEIAQLEGKHVQLQAESSNQVKIEEKGLHELITRRASSNLILQSAIEGVKNIKTPPMFTDLVVPLKNFSNQHMGAKSNNLKHLKDKVPEWINLPESICLPFQVMEHAV
jgi:alpha-glucan, water dikinase